jgi:hypothetical protein
MTPSDSAEPYDFLRAFLDDQIEAGSDEASACRMFDHYFSTGYVFKGPDYFVMGGEPPEGPSSDTWFIAWAEAHPNSKRPLAAAEQFLKLMPYYRPWVRFGRIHRQKDDKIYSTDRLIRLLSGPVQPSATKTSKPN